MSREGRLLNRFAQETSLSLDEERALLAALEERGALPGLAGEVLRAATQPRGTPRVRPMASTRPGRRRWLQALVVAGALVVTLIWWTSSEPAEHSESNELAQITDEEASAERVPEPLDTMHKQQEPGQADRRGAVHVLPHDPPALLEDVKSSPGLAITEPREDVKPSPGLAVTESSPRDTPLHERLHSPAQVTERSPLPSLTLSYQGHGTLAGPRTAPRLGWENGRLEVDLEPDTVEDLVVQTREALIRVVGTRFTVTRDGPSTVVRVHEGLVEVRCAAGTGADLRTDQTHRCGPASEAGWLALAQQLRAEPEPALQAVEAGLMVAEPQGVVATELLVLRAQLLADAGQHEPALEAVLTALNRPHAHRRTQLLELGRALAAALGDARALEKLSTESDRSTPEPGPVRQMPREDP